MTQFITLQIQDNIFMSFAVWPQDGPPAFRVPVRRLGHPARVHPVRPLALLHTEGHLRHGRHGLLPGRLRPHHREHHAQVGEQSNYSRALIITPCLITQPCYSHQICLG